MFSSLLGAVLKTGASHIAEKLSKKSAVRKYTSNTSTYSPRIVTPIGARETTTHIIIDGVNGRAISSDIKSTWDSSKISMNMFSLISQNRIMFPKFFGIDVLYMFEKILERKHVSYPKRSYQKIIDELIENTWLGDVGREIKTNILNFSKLKEIKFKPLPHQMEFMEQFNKLVPSYRLNGYMLAAAPGAGKTLNGLMLGSCLEADLIIIISPKNAVERVWSDTLKTAMTDNPEYWHSASNDNVPSPGLRYYVFHYETLDKAVELVKQSTWRKSLVILDESHNFNDIGSLRTQRFIEMCLLLRKGSTTNEDNQYVVWASGTPIKSIGSEAVPFLKTIDPFFNSDVEERFSKIYGRDSKRANDILRNRIGLVSFKVNKQEIVTNELNEHEVRVKIPNGEFYTLDSIREDMRKFIEERLAYYQKEMPQLKALYDNCLTIHESKLRSAKEKEDFRFYKKYISVIKAGYDPKAHKQEAMYCNKYEISKIMPTLPDNLKKPFKSVRSVIKYVSLKVLGETLGIILGRRRSQCHVEMVPHMGLPDIIDQTEKKTVIFTSYVEAADEMVGYLTELGYKPLVVHGGTNKDLANIIAKFDKDPDINPLVATYQSLSTAVPLIMANGVILTNSPFRDYEKNQAVSRCLRLGQTHPVHVYNLFLDTGDKPNISTRSKDILQWSAEMVSSIMGIEAPADIQSTLESYVEKQGVDMDELSTRLIDKIKQILPEDVFK